MKAVKVISYGEILFRFSPEWDQQQAAMYIGGAEANVAASLAGWGTPVAYISRVPDNGLSRQALQQLEKAGIVTDRMLLGGDRIGTYYLAQGSDLKHAEVVYDRSYSAFCELKPGATDWDALLENATWFHWSAITPALSEQAARVCQEALEAASRKGLTISTDLNYRSKLWQYAKPFAVMPELVSYCDVVMGNIWAAHDMLDTNLDTVALEQNKKEVYLEQAEKVAREITEKYTRCKHVAFTFRFSGAPTHNLYYATYYHNGRQTVSRQYETDAVVDRVGSGDSFMAGLVHGLLEGFDAQQVISFAAAAAYSKLFVKGDFNKTSKADILKLI
ncbi:sugar kinase [Chitinophaga japonensis]|uniref:2-dehydro-3-deoxygluconokinase n=1 Tax=Chitinophaga japonensis TaxID=104662 RepID=A0A562SHV7_CHIJA|nr:sugar kinase [Chitinophaga japonensis]TWI80887.1 2-dehydro-3-deoxygluconokinase [Chitinophaga japonensis]